MSIYYPLYCLNEPEEFKHRIAHHFYPLSMLRVNQLSGFHPSDRVSVTHLQTGVVENGVVHFVEYLAPLNRMIASDDKTDRIYVRFDDTPGVYSRWILRGSNILVQGRGKCIVDSYDPCSNTLNVYEDSTTLSFRPTIQPISIHEIQSMLIWLVGYDMTKIALDTVSRV